MKNDSSLNDILQLDDPQYNPLKRKRHKDDYKKKKQSIKAKSIKVKTMRWTTQQNDKYIRFIIKNKELFQIDQKRKCSGVFFKMALFLKTRNYSQCRSHHQKMIKNKTIEQLIQYCQKQQGNNQIKESKYEITQQNSFQHQISAFQDQQKQDREQQQSQSHQSFQQQQVIEQQSSRSEQNQYSKELFNVLQI